MKLNVAMASAVDQIYVKFLKNGAAIIAFYLANNITLSIKLHTFPLTCNIFLKRELKLKFKIADFFLYYL